jgi:3'-5' exoribonuclease
MSTPEITRPQISKLSELPRGQECDFFCYVASRESLLTRSGKPYLRVTIRDASRSITFPVWRDAPWWTACDEQLKAGAFCKVRGAYHESAHGPQFEVRKIRAATEADAPDGFDPAKLLPPARGDSTALFDAVRAIAESEIGNQSLRQTVCHLLDQHREGWQIQAGGRWHHAERGGLIEHTYFTVQNALALWETYSMAYRDIAGFASRDLVIAGAIIHDVGRIDELQLEAGGAATTTSGELVGHSILGRDKLRAAAQLHVDEELLLRLEHILLSHHGRTEYGAAMPPMTMEALIVHLADDCDARIIAALEVMHGEPNSDWTSKRNPTGQKWYRGAPKSPERPE